MNIKSMREEAGKKKTKKIIFLLLIIFVGFLYRTYVWFYGFNTGEHGLVTIENGYLVIASSFDPSNNIGFFDHYRSISPVYPLYLAPIYIFGLSMSVYIFWLHHVFAALTIILIYLSASKIRGTNAGLLAAWIYVCQLHIAFWFNWSQALTAFHFQLAALMYCSLICWERASPKRVVLIVITGVMLTFTRPEGAVYAGVSWLVLTYCLMASRFGAKRAIAVCLGSILAVLLSGVYVLNAKQGSSRSCLFACSSWACIILGQSGNTDRSKSFRCYSY